MFVIRNTLQNMLEHFGDRYKEHLKASSPINTHHIATGHLTTIDNFNIVDRRGMAPPEQSRNLYTLGSAIPY